MGTIRLVQNHMQKSLKSLSNIVICLVIIAGAIIISVFNKGTYEKDRWQEQLTMQNESIENLVKKSSAMSNRVKIYYDNLIEKNNYAIEHEIMPSDSYDNATSILGIDILIELLFIMMFASLVVNEYSSRTMNNMLCSPNSRGSIVLSQFITGIIIMAELLGVLMLSSLIVTGVKYGFSHLFDPMIVKGADGIKETTVIVQVVIHMLYYIPQYFFSLGVTFVIAHASKNLAVTSAVPMFLTFFGTIAADVLSKFKIGVIWPYIHTNVNQYFDGSQYYDFMSLLGSIAIVIGYIAIFYIASLFLVKRKDLYV